MLGDQIKKPHGNVFMLRVILLNERVFGSLPLPGSQAEGRPSVVTGCAASCGFEAETILNARV